MRLRARVCVAILIVAAAVALYSVSLRRRNFQVNIDQRDQQVLEVLAEQGSDLTKAHPIDFYLYFPERHRADDAARLLTTEGFEAVVRPGAQGSDWLCLVSASVVPTAENITAMRTRFETLARQGGGEYDGWETTITK